MIDPAKFPNASGIYSSPIGSQCLIQQLDGRPDHRRVARCRTTRDFPVALQAGHFDALLRYSSEQEGRKCRIKPEESYDAEMSVERQSRSPASFPLIWANERIVKLPPS